MLVNTADMRIRIQEEIDNHLAKAASLKEKLGLLVQLEKQIESLVNEVGTKPGEGAQRAAAVPEPKLEAKLEVKPEVKMEVTPAVPVPAPMEQSVQEVTQAAKDATSNGGKNPWAYMQQGFQAYLSGKLDRALELFREARELNPGGFEKTWATMTSIPVYSSVARDKYFIEGLFPSK